MHKDPIGARFISSSESSSMQPISQGLSGLFTFIQDEIAPLFGTTRQSMSISERWTARSWVITDISDAIPLVRVWNSLYSLYASHSADPPSLLAKDCEHLYTNIPLHDMLTRVLDLIKRVFHLPTHPHLVHVAVKIR